MSIPRAIELLNWIRPLLEANLLLVVASFPLALLSRWLAPSQRLRLGQALIAAALLLPFLSMHVPRETLLYPSVQIWSGAPSGDDASYALLTTAHPDSDTPSVGVRVESQPLSGVLVVWAVIALLLLVRHTAQSLRLSLNLRKLPLLRSLGRLRIVATEGDLTPYSFRSLTRAYVAVPASMLTEPDDLRISIRHELQHHRAGDTRWAHLAAIAPGLKPGDAVARGQTIGSMGRSAGGYVIPKERAHLHLELGLMVTREFQTWYATRKFGSRNDHGPWNGMNLMGIDPLDVFNAFRSKRVDTFDEYFASMGTAVRLRIATRRIPDFTQRYPTLVERGTDELIAGWEVSFNATGLPFHWRPLTIAQVMGYRPNEVRILETNEVELKSMRCRSLIVKRRGNPEPGPDLRTFLQQLFGLP